MTLVALLICQFPPCHQIHRQAITEIHKKQQDYLGHVNGMWKIVRRHIVVKAFNGEKRSIEEFNS